MTVFERELRQTAQHFHWPALPDVVVAGEDGWRALFQRADDDELREAADALLALTTRPGTPSHSGAGRQSYAVLDRDHAVDETDDGPVDEILPRAQPRVFGLGLESDRAYLECCLRDLGDAATVHWRGAAYTGSGAGTAIARATRLELDELREQLARQSDAAALLSRQRADLDDQLARRRQPMTDEEIAESQRMVDEANARAEYAASDSGRLARLVELQERILSAIEQAR
jgi:hypothetical protein